MPNDIFEFKKFIIKQNKCAMKVGTDSVLLGSWVEVNNYRKILDIGTGTGLIALMLAQKTNASITALEIDSESCEQAKENVEESNYINRIIVLNESFQNYWKRNSEKFDLIITNPPFFIDSLKSNDVNRSAARHADSLPFAELIEGVKHLLSNDGKFCLILPVKEAELFKKMANQKGFFLTKLLRVKSSEEKQDDKRYIMQFEFKQNGFTEDVLAIRTLNPQEYTAAYKQLTKDYYLNF